jgi:hypothetical protein
MGIFDIATELRLQIYSELLVLSEPINFVQDFGTSPVLRRSRENRLYPAILRVSRVVYDEAIQLLYSKNYFRFPEVFSSVRSAPTHAHIAPFLDQIGRQAMLIRHIRIPFPSFDFPVPERAKLHEVHIEDLELIGKNTNVKTLELLITTEHCNYALCDWPIASEALSILDERLRAIHSLEEVVINFEEYPGCDPGDFLTKRMHDMGWTIEIIRLPKRVWLSCDDRVEFDNEEDCNEYNNEWFREEEEREKKRENEQWLEEYWRRRDDPYWKNDSDYD